MRDRLGQVIAFVLFFVIPVSAAGFLLVWGINAMEAKSCRDKTAVYQLEYVDYGFFTGCTIKTENGTITNLDAYLTIRDGRES